MSRSIKIFVFSALWISLSICPSSLWALSRILNIRHWVAPDHTRVVIDTSNEVRFTVEKGDRRIAIDLEDTALPTHIPNLMVLNKPGLEGVIISPRSQSRVRVELSVPGQVQETVFKLRKIQDKPDRIVIDIVLPDVANQESKAREQVKVARKDRIIVIDPGHGGEAVGASGRGGTFEKDVVLAISRTLRDLLNRKEGYHAFLTRDGDYYVSFRKRLLIAREYGADLFISIHADAVNNRKVGGSSVYCLSTGGASNEAARILARNENLADVVGGVPNGDGSDVSDPIILNMFQTHAINQSKNFGNRLLQHLEGANHLKFPNVQEAPFLVLKLPDIPSVLVETAYISNPKEEKFLRSDRFQKRIAEGIVLSVADFLPPLPPVALSVADVQDDGKQAKEKKPDHTVRDPKALSGSEADRRGGGEKTGLPVKKAVAVKTQTPSTRAKVTLYRVKKGDTLKKIAGSHGTSVGALLSLNRMKPGEPLYVDRILKLPGISTEKKEEKKLEERSAGKLPPVVQKKNVFYLVKKGDTLNVIARKHGTTVRVLTDLNHLKPADPLYVNRRLLIPGNSPP